MLERDDDAFFTGLRLVARCILNGAKADTTLKEEVTRRLASAWSLPSWRLREQIGRLLVDGFSQPLLPEVRSLLSRPELEHHGAGEIACRNDDPALIREILTQRLQHGLDQFTYMHPLRPAIDRIGEEALNIYAQMVRNSATSPEAHEGLCNLIGSLDPKSVNPALALSLACDESLPDTLRLRAFSIAGNSLDARAWPLVHRALRSDDYRERWAGRDALIRSPDLHQTLLSCLRDDGLSIKTKEEIIGRIPRRRREEASLPNILQLGADDVSLPLSLRHLLRLFAAGEGHEASFRLLVENLASLELRLASATIALLGKFPSLDLGIQAAQAVQERVHDAGEAASFSHDAAIGLLYDLEMSDLGSGALRPTLPHPALQVWLDLIESWTDREDATEIQRLSLASAAVRLGSVRAVEQLHQLVLAIENPDDARYDAEDEYGHRIRGAIDELQRRRRLLPLAQIERLARCKRPNVAGSAVNALAAHGSRQALDHMIKLHNELSGHLRNSLFDAVEPVSGRLGLTVQRDASQKLRLTGNAVGL